MIRHTNSSIWTNRDGNRNVPYLDNWNGKRKLNLNWFENRWNDNCRFAAVRNCLPAPPISEELLL